MFDRHWVGDVALAILLALPLTALARPPQPVSDRTSASAGAKLASATHTPGQGRISLLG